MKALIILTLLVTGCQTTQERSNSKKHLRQARFNPDRNEKVESEDSSCPKNFLAVFLCGCDYDFK